MGAKESFSHKSHTGVNTLIRVYQYKEEEEKEERLSVMHLKRNYRGSILGKCTHVFVRLAHRMNYSHLVCT